MLAIYQAGLDTGIGSFEVRALIESTQAAGTWTVQTGIFPENIASIALHERASLRVVGVRERIGRHRVPGTKKSQHKKPQHKEPQHNKPQHNKPQHNKPQHNKPNIVLKTRTTAGREGESADGGVAGR